MVKKTRFPSRKFLCWIGQDGQPVGAMRVKDIHTHLQNFDHQIPGPRKTTLPETNSSPLKMDGWKTILSYWVSADFQGRLPLVSGRVNGWNLKIPGETSTFKPPSFGEPSR